MKWCTPPPPHRWIGCWSHQVHKKLPSWMFWQQKDQLNVVKKRPVHHFREMMQILERGFQISRSPLYMYWHWLGRFIFAWLHHMALIHMPRFGPIWSDSLYSMHFLGQKVYVTISLEIYVFRWLFFLFHNFLNLWQGTTCRCKRFYGGLKTYFVIFWDFWYFHKFKLFHKSNSVVALDFWAKNKTYLFLLNQITLEKVGIFLYLTDYKSSPSWEKK